MRELDLFYWDSCLFYEYLKGEPVSIDRRVAISEILLDNKNKANRICTSVVTHAEVIPKKLGEEAEKVYASLFTSSHFFDIEISRNILLRAREIKDYYYAEAADDRPARMMSTGDAIQLATATIYDVTEFHTRDGKRKGGNVPLLGLPESSPQGRLCGKYPLKIVSPSTKQHNLDV